MSNEALLAHSKKSQVKRGAKRASYEKSKVFALVDKLKLAHLGFISEGRAIVIPMTVWCVEEHLYFHVANKSRLQKLVEAGEELCVSLAEATEWVMAKSAYHHSINYQSAVLYCTGERVTDEQEFDQIFKAIINDVEPDRWQHIRPPSITERKATALIKLTIQEGAFKSRTGGVNEEPEDLHLPVWHGTKPICPYHAYNGKATDN